MINIEKVKTAGFEEAIRGMRNPMNSWERSDSCNSDDCEFCGAGEFLVGENDLDLMKRLFKGGTEHRKYLRFIDVTMDITAPLYWWKEFDTYKVGTVANSCSTMHKIHAKEFTLDDFSHEHLIDWCIEIKCGYGCKPTIAMESMISMLNTCRQKFLETKDKRYWHSMIQLLPSSYNQKRTVKFNYEVAVRIIEQRKGHKLDEWHVLCDELMKLPYMKEIAGLGE